MWAARDTLSLTLIVLATDPFPSVLTRAASPDVDSNLQFTAGGLLGGGSGWVAMRCQQPEDTPSTTNYNI